MIKGIKKSVFWGLCLAMAMPLFSYTTYAEETESGENCEHEYVDGVCIECNEHELSYINNNDGSHNIICKVEACEEEHNQENVPCDFDDGTCVLCGYENVPASYTFSLSEEGDDIAYESYDNYVYKIDKSGHLFIEGTPAETDRQWLEYKTQIKTATLDISGITSTAEFFKGCTNITSIDMTNLDTSEVNDMSVMFTNCWKLTNLDLSSLETGKVTNMHSMFSGCDAITALDVSGFNTSSVKDMSGMFVDCSSLTSLNLDNFNTSSVTDMTNMFRGCTSLQNISFSNFDTSKVESFAGMFGNCNSLANLDVSNFNTGNATEFSNMFQGCAMLTSLDVSNFNTDKATSMYNMFSGCENISSLAVNVFNTEKVEDFSCMFDGCHKITSINLSGFNTSNALQMGWMFQGCRELTELDVSGFVTDKVYNMNNMFRECYGLTSIDISNFDLSSVGVMEGLFQDCTGLKTVNLSGIDTSNVENLNAMFYGCSSLEEVDISNLSFDGMNPTQTEVHHFFYGASKLKKVTIPENVDKTILLPVTLYDDKNVGYTEIPNCEDSIVLHLHDYDANGICTICGYDQLAIAQGVCGDNAKWKIRDNTLIISGTGSMYDYYSNNVEGDLPPWKDNASSIKKAEINQGITNVSQYALYNCPNLEEVVLPQGLESLDEYSLAQCPKLCKITFNNDLKDIKRYAFAYTNFTTLTIPNSVEHIGSFAFLDCTNLSSINLPTSLKVVGQSIFCGCYDLTGTVTVPKTLQEVEEDPNSGFGKVSPFNSGYLSKVIIEEGTTKIIPYLFFNSGTGNNSHQVVIPDTVTEIGDYAFCMWAYSGNSAPLVATFELIIPDSVTKIGNHAFDGCDRLKELNIPGGVTSIGTNCFDSCWNLEKLSLPCWYNFDGKIKNGFESTDYSYTEIEFDGEYVSNHNFSDTYSKSETEHWKECSCGEKDSQGEHAYGEWVVTTAATHMADGVKTKTCTVCGDEKTEAIPKSTIHLFAGDYSHDDTDHWRTCECGEQEKAAHVFEGWTVTQAATETADGVKKNTCGTCGYFITDSIPKEVTKITVSEVESVGAPDSKITYITNDAKQAVLENPPLTASEKTAADGGAAISVYTKINSATVSVIDQNKVETEAGSSTICIYLDISMYRKVGSEAEVEVEPAGNPVTVSFELPEEFKNLDKRKKRTYKLIHLKDDGTTETLIVYYNEVTNTITFTTTGFSSFALAYDDTPVTGGGGGNPTEEKINDYVSNSTPNKTIVITPALAYGTVTGLSTGAKGDFACDLKALNAASRDVINHNIFANYYASQMKLRAKVLNTMEIYSPMGASDTWKKSARMISWKNTGAKPGELVYVTWYCQEAHDMRFIPAIVTSDGTVQFAVPQVGNVSIVGIVRLTK